MKKMIFIGMMLCMSFYSCNTAKVLLGEPSEAEVLQALTKVLDSSALKALVTLNKLNKQGAEGLLPEELQPVLATLKTLGLGDDVTKVENTITDVVSTVAAESGGILTDAVKEVNFGDAVSIVLGGEDAATQVLREAMYTTVKKRYSQKIEAELLNQEPEIMQYWGMATGAYNLFAKNKVDANLSDFLAEKAVDAVFLSMGAEEKKIRDNPASLGDAVVKKVFDFYQNR
ncbi:MAG: DUF4197 domain-containing protein [Saprospiraceae bacterium]|nr:DUF4197 domain-containing protein [Saprospiraceae bacterium]